MSANVILRAKAWKYGDNIDTDGIIPARYLASNDPAFLAQHCMEDVDSEFVKKAQEGDVIIGGKNFGCGSSREQPVVGLALLKSLLSLLAFGYIAEIGDNTLDCRIVDQVLPYDLEGAP